MNDPGLRSHVHPRDHPDNAASLAQFYASAYATRLSKDAEIEWCWLHIRDLNDRLHLRTRLRDRDTRLLRHILAYRTSLPADMVASIEVRIARDGEAT